MSWINRLVERILGPAPSGPGSRSSVVATDESEEMIPVACEECGHANTFPMTMANRIGECSRCNAMIDVPAVKRHRAPSRDQRKESSHVVGDVVLRFDWGMGFPRPNWQEFGVAVSAELPHEELHEIYVHAGRAWLTALSEVLKGYRVVETEHLLLLSGQSGDEAESVADFFEATRSELLQELEGFGFDHGYGKHVLLSFHNYDTYFTYVGHYYTKQGEFGGSGGMFLDGDGYRHIAIPFNKHEYRKTLVHEFSHYCVSHLPLPQWLNEGLAQYMELRLGNKDEGPRALKDLSDAKQFWTAQGLESFWSGDGFHAPGDEQKNSYLLARVVVQNLISKDLPQFVKFVQVADFRDAGQAAAASVFGFGVADIVATFLGPGDWSPKGSYQPDDADVLPNPTNS